MSQIKEEFRGLYSSMCPNKNIGRKTWTEHIYCTYIRVHGRVCKSYIQFTDPTHPNNSVLVFNYALQTDDSRRDPFRDFDNDIPNPVLREIINKNPEKN